MTKTEPQRGFCPSCELPFAVKKDGTLRHHTSWQRFQWGGARELCPGADHAPDGMVTAQ